MNVKVRMPKLFGNQTLHKTLRELTLSIVGTTVSIILTFGTAAMLEHRQQEKNRRMIAMMVISDIYDFEWRLAQEDTLRYAVWEKDLKELRTLSHDSILRLTDEQRVKYWDALSTPVSYWYDKTAENMFSSDISTFRDVRNAQFIKVVGITYSDMEAIVKTIKAKMDEKITNNKLFLTNFDTENMSDGEQLIAYLGMKEVRGYRVDFLESFRPYIQNRIKGLHNQVGECLDIIGISDDELNDFLESQQFIKQANE